MKVQLSEKQWATSGAFISNGKIVVYNYKDSRRLYYKDIASKLTPLWSISDICQETKITSFSQSACMQEIVLKILQVLV